MSVPGSEQDWAGPSVFASMMRVFGGAFVAALIGICAAVSAAHAQSPSTSSPIESVDVAEAEAEARVTRRRPGASPRVTAEAEQAVRPRVPYEFIPVEDRWRIIDSFKDQHWWDPYNFNVLKGDQPVWRDWFVNVRALSDSVYEPRRLPTPLGIQGNARPGSLDASGRDDQLILNQNLLLSLSLIQGDTVFRPPDWEFRVTGVQNFNYLSTEVVGLVNVDPEKGRTRYDHHFAIQEAFVDRHLANVSERYDFYSVRIGVQTFTTDFRGFLFSDNALGARLFGNFWNNRLQWNLAYFRRIEKDTNSGLNDIASLRRDDVYIANLYFQDFPVLGFTSQATVVHNRNDEKNRHFDNNGFLVRPAAVGNVRSHDYHVTYLGLNGDGHFERFNLTYAFYYATGTDDFQPIADQRGTIDAWFLAVEGSMDFDWLRVKAFGLYATGDPDPFDDRFEGFDTIFENPNFAGADTSFWQRQNIPFIGGGVVTLSGRNALLSSLRPSKEQGQSNFVNPGLRMIGAGADFNLTPELRFLTNVSALWWDETEVLSVLRNQGVIDRSIGWDVSGGILWRPWFTENVVLRASGSALFPGEGMRDLFNHSDRSSPFYSVLGNLILSY